MARLVFRGMAILTVRIGLLLAAFCLCLVTVCVAIPIVCLVFTLSVVANKLNQPI